MAENGAANMLLSHTFAWYFFYLRFICPVFCLDTDEKYDIYRVLMIKRVAPDVQIRKKEIKKKHSGMFFAKI